MKQVSLYLAVALSIAGCGGSSLKKLTPEQKQQVASVLNAAARTGTVSTNYANHVNNVRANNVSLRGMILSQIPGFSTSTMGSMLQGQARGDQSPSLNFNTNDSGSANSGSNQTNSNDNLSPMEDQLQDNNCQADAAAPNTGMFSLKTSEDIPEVKINVYGNSCPIEFHFDMKVATTATQTKASIDATVGIEYAVKSDDFRKLNDVDAFKLDLAVKGSGSQAGGKFNATLSGFVNSQSQGHIDVAGSASVSASQGGGQADLTLKLKMKDFTAELEVKAKGNTASQATLQYFLNGEEISEADAEKLFSDGFVLGKEAGSGIGSNSGNNSGMDQGQGQVNFPTSKR